MFKFATYISKTFFFTWITVVFGFLTLIGLLDSLANGGDIVADGSGFAGTFKYCLLYTSPSPRDRTRSRMPSSA